MLYILIMVEIHYHECSQVLHCMQAQLDHLLKQMMQSHKGLSARVTEFEKHVLSVVEMS